MAEAMDIITKINTPFGQLDPATANIVNQSSLEQLGAGTDAARKNAMNVSTKEKEKPKVMTVEEAKKGAADVLKQAGTVKTKEQLAAEEVKKMGLGGGSTSKPKLTTESVKPVTEALSMDELYKNAITKFDQLDQPFLHVMPQAGALKPEEQERLQKEKAAAIADQRGRIMNLMKSAMSPEEKMRILKETNAQLDAQVADFAKNSQTVQGQKPVSANAEDVKKLYQYTPVSVTGEKKDTKDVEVKAIDTVVNASNINANTSKEELGRIAEKATKQLKGMPDNTLRDVLQLIAKSLLAFGKQSYTMDAEKENDFKREMDKMIEALKIEREQKLGYAQDTELQQAENQAEVNRQKALLPVEMQRAAQMAAIQRQGQVPNIGQAAKNWLGGGQ